MTGSECGVPSLSHVNCYFVGSNIGNWVVGRWVLSGRGKKEGTQLTNRQGEVWGCVVLLDTSKCHCLYKPYTTCQD